MVFAKPIQNFFSFKLIRIFMKTKDDEDKSTRDVFMTLFGTEDHIVIVCRA